MAITHLRYPAFIAAGHQPCVPNIGNIVPASSTPSSSTNLHSLHHRILLHRILKKRLETHMLLVGDLLQASRIV